MTDGAPGVLYVVATPIGNLGDLSARAAEVLGACAVVAAEDTRRFRILAERHGLRPHRVLRCDERAESRAVRKILAALADGLDVALTTDAGTPGVADPGGEVVRAAAAAGFRVVPLPGPCAPVAALSASGLRGDRFAFGGFPPRRPGALRAFLEERLARPETLILLESPERLAALLQAVADIDPDRESVVARELTKVHEEIRRGPASVLRAGLETAPARGEVVVAVAGGPSGAAPAGNEELAAALLRRPWAGKLSRRDLAELLALACGLERNAAYRLAQEAAPRAGPRGHEGRP